MKIPKHNADQVRKILLNYSLIDLTRKIKRDQEFVYIPLNREPGGEFKKEATSEWEIVDTSFEYYNQRPTSLMGYLEDSIGPEKVVDIKKSFDIIGDLVILEIPDELADLKYKIAEAALKFTRRKSVYRKKSKILGVMRTRTLEFLAGDDQSETTHTEYGSRYLLDVRKVYFSPRLATERERIVEQVKDSEVIIDLFAGVGPFSINIARRRKVGIYAVDINPDAVYYLKKNIELNRLKGEIKPVLGDAHDVLSNLKVKADRLIMNLPGTAAEYLEDAVRSLKPGGTIHYYEFASDYEAPVQRIKDSAMGRKVTILDQRKVKSSSPGRWHVGIDACIDSK